MYNDTTLRIKCLIRDLILICYSTFFSQFFFSKNHTLFRFKSAQENWKDNSSSVHAKTGSVFDISTVFKRILHLVKMDNNAKRSLCVYFIIITIIFHLLFI